MPSARNQLIELFEQDKISPENMVVALSVSNVSPSNQSWHTFINRLLLWIGGLSLAFAGMFFIAYNWIEIGHLTKFAMVESALVLTIVGYWKIGHNTIAGKVSLLMATIFLGVLLALFGQTYQTGADPWQLFFNWTIFMLPWAIIGRFSAIWLVWILLINLTIVLYHQAFRNVLWLLFSSENQLLWILYIFNTATLIIWQLLAEKWQWLQQNWAIRILATASGVLITWLVLFNIFDGKGTLSLAGIVWIIWMVAMYWVYRKVVPDLFMLAGFCLSGIVVITFFQTELLINAIHAGSLLFIAIQIIGLATGAAIWLKNVHRELQ